MAPGTRVEGLGGVTRRADRTLQTKIIINGSPPHRVCEVLDVHAEVLGAVEGAGDHGNVVRLLPVVVNPHHDVDLRGRARGCAGQARAPEEPGSCKLLLRPPTGLPAGNFLSGNVGKMKPVLISPDAGMSVSTWCWAWTTAASQHTKNLFLGHCSFSS